MATMNQMETLVRRALRCQYNIMFLSQPALGKTTTINRIAQEEQAANSEFYFGHFDGGTLAPTDVVMSMPDMTAHEIVKLVDGRIPNAYNTPDMHGLIYIGEWMLMGIEVNRGFQKLVNHEDLGGFRVPDGVIFVADGNRVKDRSGGQQQSRALMSRFETHEIDYDPEYALAVMRDNYHERVAAFAIRFPGNADTYEDVFENDKRGANDLMVQEGKLGIWPNLRSWKRVSDKMRDAETTGIALLPGEIERNVGSGMGATFHSFCSMLDKLATLEEIIADPKKVEVSKKMDEQYALSVMLALLVNKENWESVATYMQRHAPEIQTVYFQTMNSRLARTKDANSSAIRSSKTYKAWITSKHISDLLRGASAA